MKVIRVQREDFDVAQEIAAITRERKDIGALVVFAGLCRDEGGALAALELEHYPGMAEAEIDAVVEDARRRWPLQAVTIVHRYGLISAGEKIVLVLTASSHRGDAFSAAEFLMDYLKTRAPFWKRERRLDGAAGAWVGASQEDEHAAERWRKDETRSV
ncbi:MAG TPA: molybdenum cofactor biosynthesis protein MoaE [Beijerinckiaceae bacterium]|nr:molybdenum cofactor biosynthesis protein MoaE [Beijerinckiaceae bacterium]HVB90068.1 molybdenum cofactor biosynthesis protein MoaE [Beijerinckiaceae bacterium]